VVWQPHAAANPMQTTICTPTLNLDLIAYRPLPVQGAHHGPITALTAAPD